MSLFSRDRLNGLFRHFILVGVCAALLHVGWFSSLGAMQVVASDAGTIGTGPVRGVALAGGSFGDGTLSDGTTPMNATSPGTYGVDWFYEVDGQARTSIEGLRYLKSRGITTVRIDFRWERLQPRLGGHLDPHEVGRLLALLDALHSLDMKAVLDCHNYGHYKEAGSNDRSPQGGTPLGSGAVSIEAFADLWTRIATTFGAHPAVLAYELMNEPVDLSPDVAEGARIWQSASQAAVEAIRGVGDSHLIYVDGYDWARVQQWEQINGPPWIDDPVRNTRYAGHHYWDGPIPDSIYGSDSPASLSGDVDTHTSKVLSELKEFTDWLDKYGVEGAITEVGWPNNASVASWNLVADAWYRAADLHRLDVFYWAAGSAWGSYENAAYTASTGLWHEGAQIDTSRPQSAIIERHLRRPRVSPFVDVADDNPHAADIAAIHAAGVTNGTGKGRFSPTLGVTREQMASFLTRALGLGVSDVDFFIDDDSSSHQPDINSIADRGITTGCAESRFCPTDGLTRGEMAMFLFRVLQPEPSHTDFFVDDDDHPFEHAIDALASLGIVFGTGENRFQPDTMITREQMASLLVRAFDL